MRSIARAAAPTVLSVTMMLVACVGDSINIGGSVGGQRNQPFPCSMGPLNAAWTNARLSGNRTQPEKCPYEVTVPNTNLIFSANVFGPKQYLDPNSSATLWPIRSQFDQVAVVSSQSQYFVNDPNLSTGRMVTFTGNYLAGHVVPGVNYPWSHDSGWVSVSGAYTGLPEAYITLSGAVRLYQGQLIVPAQLISGSQVAFRAYTDVDTNAYNFSWRVDGSSIPANNDADLTTSFPLAGNHQVTAYAAFADGVDTISATVNVKLYTALNGPSSVKKTCPAEWYVAVSGHTGALTYAWTLNGSSVGTNSSTYGMTVNWIGTKTLSVYTSDGAGNSRTTSMAVVGTTTGTCQF